MKEPPHTYLVQAVKEGYTTAEAHKNTAVYYLKAYSLEEAIAKAEQTHAFAANEKYVMLYPAEVNMNNIDIRERKYKARVMILHISTVVKRCKVMYLYNLKTQQWEAGAMSIIWRWESFNLSHPALRDLVKFIYTITGIRLYHYCTINLARACLAMLHNLKNGGFL